MAPPGFPVPVKDRSASPFGAGISRSVTRTVSLVTMSVSRPAFSAASPAMILSLSSEIAGVSLRAMTNSPSPTQP